MNRFKRPSPEEASELSEHELAALRLCASGKPIATVARHLDVSERTLRRHLRDVCDRVGVDTVMEAVVWAVRRGLI
jgi:DNA-binding NarL/FixJ family response regulator